MRGLLLVAGLLLGLVVGTARTRSVATYDQRQEGKVNVQIDVKDVQIVALVDSDMLDDYTNYDYAYDYADFTIKPSSRPTSTSKPPSSPPSDTSSPSSSSVEIWSTWPTNPPSTSSTPSGPSDSSSTTLSFTFDELSTSSSSTKSPAAPETPSSTSSDVPVIVTEEQAAPATIIVKLLEHESTPAPATDDRKIVEGIGNASKIEAEKQQQILSDAGSSTTTAATTTTTTTVKVALVVGADDTKPNGSKRPYGVAEPRKRCPAGFLLKSGKCFKRRYSLISPRLALMKLAPALLSKTNILSGISAAASS